MKNPTINQYLLSTCLFIIDEFNDKYKSKSIDELKIIADEKYNEMDICVRIGYPFKQMVHYTVGDSQKNRSKVNHDLYIESKDFKVEVKYLKNWDSGLGKKSNSKKWEPFQEDFNWLLEEIKTGNKGKRAFVIGWFNCVERFSQLIQLGEGQGPKPIASEKKICYFPFLRKLKSPTYTQDLVYNYTVAYKSIPVNLIGSFDTEYDCLFLGNENDLFHFAIYF